MSNKILSDAIEELTSVWKKAHNGAYHLTPSFLGHPQTKEEAADFEAHRKIELAVHEAIKRLKDANA